MQSPFLAEEAPAIEQPQTEAAPLTEETLDKLNKLIKVGLVAKRRYKRLQKVYDSCRQQVCDILVDIREEEVVTEFGKGKTKETKSEWIYSEATQELEKQLKLQQEIEKRTGVAKPGKVTTSADLS
jgi:hypothetical protein